MRTALRSRMEPLLMHVRLWRRLVGLAMAREMQYRAHFLTTVGVGTAQLALALVPVLLLYTYADDIRGWSSGEVIALVGLFQLVSGLLGAFVAPNMAAMTELIKRGDLDLVLVRPVSAQFYATVRTVAPGELINVMSGLAVVIAGLIRAGRVPSVVDVVQAVLALGAGLVLLTCVWSAMAYLAFWLVSVGPVPMLFHDLLRAGQYPVAFFPAAVRAVLMFAFPVAFATTFPIEALSGDGSWTLIATSWVVVAVAVVLLRLYWLRAVRGYASASS